SIPEVSSFECYPEWSAWSKCDKCDEIGQRKRVGECRLQRFVKAKMKTHTPGQPAMIPPGYDLLSSRATPDMYYGVYWGRFQGLIGHELDLNWIQITRSDDLIMGITLIADKRLGLGKGLLSFHC
ncbi:hypothetical protein TNIN_332211, partial [Trichonephila inaurata madagascariensis]